MINGKRTRNGKNSAELEKDIQKFFDENDHYSIEGLYLHIGITKYNFYDWTKGTNKTHKRGAAIIKEAKDIIYSNLAHEMTNEENSTRLKARTMYMRSRYKDNGEAEPTNDDKGVTINIGNSGPNKLLGNKND